MCRHTVFRDRFRQASVTGHEISSRFPESKPGTSAPGGLTLIEVLVAISIVAVLVAITFPAVQSTRETARKASCASNLRQIGLAAANYESAFGAYPTEHYPFRALLPFIGHADQYAAFSIPSRPVATSPEAYICPSDERASRAQGHVSYPLNEGYGFQRYGKNGIRLAPRNKPFHHFVWTRRVDVTDGLSNTAFASERLVSGWYPEERTRPPDPRRYLWYLPARYTGADQYDDFLRACQTRRTTVIPVVFGGWNDLSMWIYGYNHCQVPNSVGCNNASVPATGLLEVPFDFHSVPATSQHAGGVNLLMCDGAVHFVSNSVDSGVWNAVSTRAGAEPPSEF